MSYREIFDEAIGHTPPTWVDVDRVIRRQRRAARVRPALAVVAAAVVVASGAGTAIRLTGDEVAADPAESLAGFPEYAEGARVIAAEEAVVDQTLSLTFTADTRGLVLLARCESDYAGAEALFLSAELATGGANAAVDAFCTTPGAADSSGRWDVDGVVSLRDRLIGEEFWAEVAVGEPTTITASLVGAWTAAGDFAAIPYGTFGVAVAEPVPFEEYPLPPRPYAMNSLPDITWVAPGPVEIRADRQEPNRPVEATFQWEADHGLCHEGALPIETSSDSPGTLRVLVNGVEVATPAWWDYEQASLMYGLGPACDALRDGDAVTVTVEPEHMTGDWRVVLAHPHE
jgi:hypothetical protein